MPSVTANTAMPSAGRGCATGCAADAETRGNRLVPLNLCDLAPRSTGGAMSTPRSSTTGGANECPRSQPTQRGRARGRDALMAVQPTRGNARNGLVPVRTRRVRFRRSPLRSRRTFGAPLAILDEIRSLGCTLAARNRGNTCTGVYSTCANDNFERRRAHKKC